MRINKQKDNYFHFPFIPARLRHRKSERPVAFLVLLKGGLLEIREYQNSNKCKRRGIDQTVKPVEQPPVTGEDGATVLLAGYTLELGFD